MSRLLFAVVVAVLVFAVIQCQEEEKCGTQVCKETQSCASWRNGTREMCLKKLEKDRLCYWFVGNARRWWTWFDRGCEDGLVCEEWSRWEQNGTLRMLKKTCQNPGETSTSSSTSISSTSSLGTSPSTEASSVQVTSSSADTNSVELTSTRPGASSTEGTEVVES